jgi:hypothetical protein
MQFPWFSSSETRGASVSCARRKALTLLSILVVIGVATPQQPPGRKVSGRLSSFLDLSSSQRKSITAANDTPSSDAEKHTHVVVFLTKEQREKLTTLYSSAADEKLRAEALSLHLLCPPRHFGGAATKFSASTCVDQSTGQNPAPANAPQ